MGDVSDGRNQQRRYNNVENAADGKSLVAMTSYETLALLFAGEAVNVPY